MRSIRERLQTFANDKTARVRVYAFTGMIFNIVWSLGKMAIGIFSGMFFFSISGIHTLLIGIVKSIFFRNYTKVDAAREVYVSRVIGALTATSAAIFVLYMARLFFVEEDSFYGLIPSITIAAFSFGELGMSIGGFVKSRKRKDLMLFSLKGSKIASGLYAIVLTQTAILSAQGESGMSKYNALSGVAFGGLALVVGIGVIIYTFSAKGIKKAVQSTQEKAGGTYAEEENISE